MEMGIKDNFTNNTTSPDLLNVENHNSGPLQGIAEYCGCYWKERNWRVGKIALFGLIFPRFRLLSSLSSRGR
jgi:hypothetical protein